MDHHKGHGSDGHGHGHGHHAQPTTSPPNESSLLDSALMANSSSATTTLVPLTAMAPSAQHHEHLPEHHVISQPANQNGSTLIGGSGHHQHDDVTGSGHAGAGHENHLMLMYFHGGYQEVVLFSFWTISTQLGLLVSCAALAIAAFVYEGLKLYREQLYTKQICLCSAKRGSKKHRPLREDFSTASFADGPSPGDKEMGLLNGGPKTPGNQVPSCCGDTPPGTAVIQPTGNQHLDAMDGPRCKCRYRYTHLVQTALHVIQLIVSYLLMLVFMTYNVWLCLAVALGSGAGYLTFGWRRRAIALPTTMEEHCNG